MNAAFLKAKRVILFLSYRVAKVFGIDRRTLSILCYHTFRNPSPNHRWEIDPKTFEKQVEKISGQARFVSIEEALGALRGKKVAGPAVALTFDDGFRDVLEILPVTRKYRIPAAIFVLARPENTDHGQLRSQGTFLDLSEIKKLYEEGWTIGCHSATHTDLKRLGQDELEEEVSGAKKMLESRLGIPIEYFAYPRGIFSETIVAAVRKAGYKAAFTTEPGGVERGANPWLVPRTVIDQTHRLSEFPQVYSPSSFFFRKLLARFKLYERFS